MARVLLVEDDPMMVELLQDILASAGHKIAHAGDGVAALIHLGVVPPDEIKRQLGITEWNFVGNEWSDNPAKKVLPEVIVTDCMMPRMDGFTLVAQIAGDDQTKDIPVVVLTTKAKMEETFLAYPNVKGFMAKPADPSKLLDLVANALLKL